MANITLTKQVKVSDNNYGNSTTDFTITVDSKDLVDASFLLESWAAAVKQVKSLGDDDELTVREMKNVEASRVTLREILERLAALAV